MDVYSIAPLVAAVIYQAAADARAGDRAALTWLQTDGIVWADAIGIDLSRTIPRWVNASMPKPIHPRGALRLAKH
jgi:hypothetical protein